MKQIIEQIAELNQIYNDLGEDLIFLEAVVTALRTGYEFPEEYTSSDLKRIADYIGQHTGEIQHTSQFLCRAASSRSGECPPAPKRQEAALQPPLGQSFV